MKPFQFGDLYHGLVILVIVVSSWCPYGLRRLLVQGIVEAGCRFSRAKRKRMLANLARVFPEPSDSARYPAILRGAFTSFWRDILRWKPSREDEMAYSRAQITGLDRLRDALAAGRGVILWESNGFGQKLAGHQILNRLGFPVCVVHGPHHLGGFYIETSPTTWMGKYVNRAFFDRCEARWSREIFNLPVGGPMAFTRWMRDRLRQNDILCVSGDGKGGRKLIPLPFLDQTEYFATGMVSMAGLSGAPILPIFCLLDADENLRLVVEPPLRMDHDADRETANEKCIAQFISLLEAYIRRYPEQYRNWHLLGYSPPDSVLPQHHALRENNS